MNNKVIVEIIKIVCTAIISIATVLFCQSCTASFSLFKNNTSSTFENSQSTSASADSANVALPINLK